MKSSFQIFKKLEILERTFIEQATVFHLPHLFKIILILLFLVLSDFKNANEEGFIAFVANVVRSFRNNIFRKSKMKVLLLTFMERYRRYYSNSCFLWNSSHVSTFERTAVVLK